MNSQTHRGGLLRRLSPKGAEAPRNDSTFLNFLADQKRFSFLFFFLSFSIFFLNSCNGGGKSFAPGVVSPSISLRTLRGDVQSLEHYRGKIIVLNFWASWCGPCLQEVASLERLHAWGSSRNIQVVSIGIDDESSTLQQVVEREGISFPVLVDDEAVVKRLYKIQGVPETFILDQEGKFILFPDPEGRPSVRISGPRKWDSQAMISRLLELFPTNEKADT